MLNKILGLFKKPVVQIDQVNDRVKTVNSEPVNPQITDAVTQKSKQARVVEAAVKDKIVKPAVKAKADVQTAKKTRVKKPKQ